MITNKSKYLFITALFPIFLSGCYGTRHLKENQYLHFSQKIQGSPNLEKGNLKEILENKPNRTLFGVFAPWVGLYYWGKNNYDPKKFEHRRAKKESKFDRKIAAVKPENQKKINNLQFRKKKKTDKINNRIENGNLLMQWGEPLSVFDSTTVNINQQKLHDYLFSKGYFQNQVDVKVNFRENLRQGNETYTITPGKVSHLDTLFYFISDSAITSLLKQHKKQSFLKQGDPYDQNNFSKERERIDYLLKDYGYYDFSRQYIEFNIDTSYSETKPLAVLIFIRDPSTRGFHKKFTIDSINFITDAGAKGTGARKQNKYHGINYFFYERQYNLKTLTQRISLIPSESYSRTNTFNTQRQLANLDAFKFVNINYDTSGGGFIANIFTSALDRYQWSNEAGVNVTQGYPGPFYNIGFKKRNVFRGLETFDLTGRIGYEGVASATREENVYQSTEAGVNASLTFPQFIWPFKEKTQMKLGKYNPKTKLTVGYSYSERPEYKRTSTSFNHTYSWQNQRTSRYEFTPGSLNIIYSEIKDQKFDSLLTSLQQQGNNLKRSFDPSFVSSTLFNVTWNLNNYGNKDQNSLFIRTQFESGGTLWNLASPDFITNQGLELFKFFRFNLDIRRNRVVSHTATLAYRFNAGVAYPYNTSKSLPYEKFFFAGGSNSIRAWRPRRIGPGTFKPDSSINPILDGIFSYSIEKPADILLEASLEWRQKLFGFVDGAIFLDIGNVWTFDPLKKINPNTLQEIPNGNSQFRINTFYKELGVGTGFGLRFDFTFLILRFDVGIKVVDPARDEKDRFVLNDIRFLRPFATQKSDGTFYRFKEPVIYNIGIGFPF